jgi:hypothetical protein
MLQLSATRNRLSAHGHGKSDCRVRRAAVRLRIRVFAPVLAFSLLCLQPAFSADDPGVRRRLTNQDVVAMVSAGISEEVIVAKIRTTSAAGVGATNFDTSVEGLKALKAANVPDVVVKAMIDPTPAAPTVVSLAGPATLNPNLPPPEVGMYWKDGGNFVLIQGQAISQSKVGGKAGNVFSYGIKRVHWDAFLNGATSNNRVRELRPIFYVYVPDGASAADYVLLRLHKKGDRREFQIGSFGGWLGGTSGVERDREVPFKSDHVGIRIYKLSLNSDLKPGEYAFFMGTGQQSATGGEMAKGAGGAATGRVYDFTIPE